MLKSKYANPLDSFVVHGEKVISGYTYILLVDESGQSLIKRVSSDNSSIMFSEMSNPGSFQQDVIAAAITAFWASPTTGNFVYLFQLQ